MRSVSVMAKGQGAARAAIGGAIAGLVLISGIACRGESRATPSVANAPPTTHPESTGSNTGKATGTSTGTSTGTASVVILGTSLTAGLGLDPEQAYPALLQRKADSAGLRIRIVNAGLSGETSAGALRRASWVLEQPAAIVVLEVGANDGLRGVDPDSTRANIEALVKVIRGKQPSARVLLVQMEAPTNLGQDYVTRFHAVFAKAAHDAHIPLVPFLLDGVAGIASLNQGDGIHPNVTGSRRVADNMWNALLPVLTSVAPSTHSLSPVPR